MNDTKTIADAAGCNTAGGTVTIQGWQPAQLYVCPGCGRCLHCGHGPNQYPVYPMYPQPWYPPWITWTVVA